jgi:hypothetical protein
MTDPVLQADLIALGRLKPEVERLAGEVAHGVPGEIPFGAGVEGAAVPSLAAAQEMSARTLPALKATVAERFTMLADLVERALKGFITTEGLSLTAINDVPTQPQPQPLISV